MIYKEAVGRILRFFTFILRVILIKKANHLIKSDLLLYYEDLMEEQRRFSCIFIEKIRKIRTAPVLLPPNPKSFGLLLYSVK
ncbi:hypothetical protein N780_15320 [Pontibacillus chungwhensis BH030062]|uniref:Uncharacterized protein n=1 Tax=Pontibacillus chungwhensis BH030062 TaxID=1385513 RepID=A0A0A2VEA0_9BACI|nr:hypothetical protein N780_15320 [Pontibacillus chungwhensis BH030062]